jgi:hypothetical protein
VELRAQLERFVFEAIFVAQQGYKLLCDHFEKGVDFLRVVAAHYTLEFLLLDIKRC